MNWEVVASAGQVLGSVAVVATLFYVTLQIREMKRSNRSVAHATWAAGQGALLGLASANRELSELLQKGWFSPNELDERTWYPFMAWHQQLLYHTAAIHRMHTDGVADDDLLELELNKAVAVLRTPGASQWWQAGGQTHISETLASLLDERLERPNRWSTIVWSRGRGFHALELGTGSRAAQQPACSRRPRQSSNLHTQICRLSGGPLNSVVRRHSTCRVASMRFICEGL